MISKTVDCRAMIPGEKLEKKKRKENTQIYRGSANCPRLWEQGRRLLLYHKLELHKRVFILTLG